jgi:surface protein
MSGMFWENPKFNGDISSWDVSNVDNMSCMFFNAKSFKKDLSMWNVKDSTNLV